ncbi:hypothetical protein FRC11_004011 [Ceratobasidium sp. 423]|nr:hypothetical protein FRC11_004011 [Ceratobasidium sp. 423]
MTHTRNQKRQLEDPGDISISRAPQASKKGRKKTATKGATDSMTPAPNMVLPTSLTNPTPTDVSLEESTDTPSSKGTKSTAAPENKPPRKKKAAKGAATATSLDVSAETPQAPPANTITSVASIEGTQTTGKRKKNPSLVAQQVALQEAIDNDKKVEKKKKQVKKAASAVINESPEATRAFLERMKAAATDKPENSAMPHPPGSAAPTTASSGVTDHTADQGGKAPLSKRTALNQLIRAHQSPGTATTASIVSAGSSFSSLTPSESVSQGIAASATPEAPSRPQSKKKTKAPTQSTLAVPSSTPSRDASPFPEQLADGDLAEYGSDLGIDPTKLLDGIPTHLAPLLTMPEPLPEPLYTPERLVPLPAIDLSVFPAAERAKIKAKRQLKVRDLKPADNAVVSSAISRFGALLVTVCGFPDSQTAWLLACNANHWASKKHGRHLKLTKNSEYLKLLYDRIPQMRAGLVGSRAKTDVALAYKLEIASSEGAIKANSSKVKHLLKDANFTLASLDSSGGMYEHVAFKETLKNGLFRSADATGVVHNDLFSTISLPCMALTAAAVEKVLRSYKSGTQVDNRFNANDFTPVYFSHLATLAAIYNIDEAQNQLVDHLQETADELRKPYLGFIRSQTTRHVRPLIPQAMIAARYRAVVAPNATPNANIDLPERRPKKPASTLTQELVCQVKMQLGVPRSVSVSSTPESEVVHAIYDATQAGRNTGSESFSGLLAQVAGSSDSEVQAMRAGALKSNAAGNAIIIDSPGSDSSDEDPVPADSATPEWRDVSGGDGPSQATGTPGAPAGKEPALSGDGSEDSDDETDGEGAAGLVSAAQHPGDVTMNTVDGTSSSEDEDGEEEEGEEGEGKGEGEGEGDAKGEEDAEEDDTEGEDGAEGEDGN